MRLSRPVPIVGAGVVSGLGLAWRGLGRAILEGEEARGEIDLPGGADAGDARQRKLMSRAARLASVAQRLALADAGFADGRDEIGAFLGVGASGAALADLEALVRVSTDPASGAFSAARCGGAGLAACNPLFAFQTMNNFTLCHGAILEGLGGPNGAFFSRGAGTHVALAEALHALDDGDCERALAGAADTALHPLTAAELTREGFAAHVGGEGAAVLALAAAAPSPLAVIEACDVFASLDDVDTSGADLLVIAPWGPPARDRLLTFVAGLEPSLAVADATDALGDALAASPALAWAAALDLLVEGRAACALVLTAGVDGDFGVVRMAGVA